MHTLGHFDIYGCLFAIVLLLMPARSLFYVGLAALFSMMLVLIHHIHLLMYVPTIATIVVLRHYLVHRVSRGHLAGVAALAAIGALFIVAQFFGTMAVPETDFVNYLQEPDGRSLAHRSAAASPTSGTSRCRRRLPTPGRACRTTVSAFPSSRC